MRLLHDCCITGFRMVLLAMSISAISSCGGTKVLSEPRPLDISQPLTTVSDAALTVELLAVIVRDSPGTWARNADWDEYLLSISSHAETPVELTGITLVDLMGLELEPSEDRKQLVSQSKESIRRYRDSEMKITSGIGAGRVIAGGAAVAIVGASVAAAAAPAALMAGGVAVGTGAAMVASAVVLSPVFAVAGLKRMSNGRKVSAMIEERAGDFPMSLAAGSQQLVDVFFPLAPAPQEIRLVYTDNGKESFLSIPLQAVLPDLHITP